MDWVQVAENYVQLHACGRQRLLHVPMNTLAAALDPEVFLRIHRSSIVNVRRIRSLTPTSHGQYAVVLKSGVELQSAAAKAMSGHSSNSASRFRQTRAILLALDGKPSITIHVPGPLRSYCENNPQLSIAAGTVLEALQVLERDQSDLYRNICDETGAVRRHLNVFVNADHVRDLAGVHTILKTGDVVTFLPAVSGG